MAEGKNNRSKYQKYQKLRNNALLNSTPLSENVIGLVRNYNYNFQTKKKELIDIINESGIHQNQKIPTLIDYYQLHLPQQPSYLPSSSK